MFKSIKIGLKITVLMISVVSLTVLAVSVIAYYRSAEAFSRRYEDSFRVIGEMKAKEIEKAFLQIDYNLNRISSSQSVIASLYQMDTIGFAGEDSMRYVQSLVDSRLDTSMLPIQEVWQYRNIAITDARGKIIYNSNEQVLPPVFEPMPDTKGYREAARESNWYGKPESNDDGVIMKAVTAIRDERLNDEPVIGYGVLTFDLREVIFPIVNDTTGLQETGEILLVMEDGASVKTLNSLRKKESNPMTDNTSKGLLDVRRAIQSAPTTDKPVFAPDIDYMGDPTLTYRTRVPFIGWGLVVKIDEAEASSEITGLTRWFFWIGLIVISIAFLISFVFSSWLIRPLLSLKAELDLVSQGVLPENVGKHTTNDEIGEMAYSVQRLVQSLRGTAEFAHKIGEGDFNAEFRPNSENDTLGNALITMRDSIQTSEQRDRERNWIVSGVAEIGQILRNHDTLEDLGDEVIAFITEKIEAVQGAFYVVEESLDSEEEIIEMKASYAYHKKKYLKSSFRFAEGLVGQAAIEQDLVVRTEIPENYMSITSGLIGDQKPSALLIAPLITDEKVYGVLEFAGFDRFTEAQIGFVKEISLIIARTIFNIKVNDQTRRLLEESQRMGRELKSQGEVLRQNAETMQANQEALRSAKENLERQVEEVNNTRKRMAILLENASEIITIYEKSGRVRYISPSIEPILGYSQNEMIGTYDEANLHPRSVKVFKSMFNRLIDSPDEQMTVQYEYRKKNGTTVWMEATGTNLLADPAIQGIVVNSRDITERRRAEQEQRMRSAMQSLSENSPDLITRVNTQGVIFYINPVIERMTGNDQKEFESKPLDQVELDPKVLSVWKKAIKEVIKTKTKRDFQMDFPTQDGPRIMQVNAIPEFGDKGKSDIESVLLVSHDITESKEAEQQIISKNRKITESINYAKRIQSAILPDNDLIRKTFPESFIFYKPRDVVSGDFPWFLRKGDTVYIAAVDCTGHGVPGALISLIGYFILNDVINTQKVSEAGQILDRLNVGVTRTLRQETNSTTSDGMDIALCKIDLKTGETQYAGAHRPLLLYRDGKLTSVKGDRFPIGGSQYKNRAPFSTHSYKMKRGDELYIFSDGLPDQFGGPENRKFSPKRVRELIDSRRAADMDEMLQLFEQELGRWQGNQRQTDDILLIGIKF